MGHCTKVLDGRMDSICYMKNEIISAQKPSVDLQEAMLAAKLQPSPKFEKIKPMIPEIVAHLKEIGWIEKEAE
jgi:hypothetical protein